MEPTFSYAELTSNTYRWRENGGRMLVCVFSQPFPLGTRSSDTSVWKTLEQDPKYGNMDVDVTKVRSLFQDEKKPFKVPVDFVYKPLLTCTQVRKYIASIDKEAYDCFFFAFLTYTQPANTVAKKSGKPMFNDERIHFNDTTLEKGIVSFEEILDEVKSLKVAVGKPKIFLIQADDISYLEGKTHEKGPTFVPDVIKMKIPRDTDRLIIRSTIPQKIASSGPSFLVQAFVDAVRDNATKGKEQQEDLLTLTTRINAKVSSRIRKSKHFRKDDFSVPLTTSTLTKLLYL